MSRKKRKVSRSGWRCLALQGRVEVWFFPSPRGVVVTAEHPWEVLYPSVEVVPWELARWMTYNDFRRYALSFLKKMENDSARPASGSPISDRDFVADYPALAEYLCATRYPDGSERRTSTIVVFVEDGAFKAGLNDRDNDRSLFLSSTSFSGLLGSLEAMLQADDQPWRRNRQEVQKPQGNRKKST